MWVLNITSKRRQTTVTLRSCLLLIVLMYWHVQLSVVSALSPPLACPTGWFGHEASQKCYKVYHNVKLKRPMAKNFCRKQGGELVDLNERKVNEFIKEHLSTSKSYWIGLIPRAKKWLGGRKASFEQYEDWVKGFNYNNTNFNCAIFFMQPKEGFRWKAFNCNQAFHFVCQAVPGRAKCTTTWTIYRHNDTKKSTCLKLFRPEMNRKGAEESCAKRGGHLVTADSRDKDIFVKGLISGPSVFYINKVNSSVTIPFLGWGANQPTADPTDECSVLWSDDHEGGYHVHDSHCDSSLPYICEKESTCTEGWNLFKGTCIRVFYEKIVKYADAENYCGGMDAKLAIIPDEETNTFVTGLVTIVLTYWCKEETITIGYMGEIVERRCCYVMRTGRDSIFEQGDCSVSYRFICMKVVSKRDDCDGDYLHMESDSSVTCYHMPDFTATRDEADDYCQKQFDGRLFNGNFNGIAASHATRASLGFYFGLSASSNDWSWSDNTTYILNTSMFWANNEPNARYENDCALCYAYYGLPCEWHDTGCNNKLSFICQKDPICPSNWHLEPSGQKCFGFLRNDPRTWTAAQKQCKLQGGNLFDIGNEGYNKFIIDHISAGPKSLWIGATYNNRVFKWKSNNMPLTYEDWAPYEPNYPRKQRCVTYKFLAEKNLGYMWNNHYCHSKHGYVCEIDMFERSFGFECPEGYTVFAEGETCFKVLHNARLRWKEARDVCEKEDGDLAVVYDNSTDVFLSGLLTKSNSYWLGLRSIAPDLNKYLWINGNTEQDTSVVNWLPDEPSSPLEQCINFIPRPNWDLSTPGKYFGWKDDRCSKKMGAICQRGGATESYDLHEAVIEGDTYYFGLEGLHAGDVENECKQHNLTQLFIQSNDHFAQIQAWVSNTSGLQDSRIWVQTKKPLFWDFNTWSDNDFVHPDAWVSDIQDRVCSKEQECCVTMVRDTRRPEHYLANTKCSDTAIYICVKENNNTVSKISPPKIEPAKKSAETLKQLMTSSNQTQNNKCPCRCGVTFNPNPTPAELDLIKAHIIEELIIKTDVLIATVSKKVSARDDRASSQTFGFLAIVCMCLPFVFIIAIDIIRIWQRKSE